MKPYRLVFLLAVSAIAFGCSEDDEIVTSSPPPIAGVRFINAVNDTGAVDIRMLDQVEWSALALSQPFRGATTAGAASGFGQEYQPTEAKSRPVRVFLAATSTILHDETLTFEAGANYTVLYVGSARSNTDRFVIIKDEPPVPSGIAVRVVNASTGTISAYLTATTTSTITPPETFANIATNSASAYSTRAAGGVAAHAVAPGSTTPIASAAGPTAPADIVGARPAAGVDKAGTALSAIYFPAGVTGSQAAAYSSAGIVWFVDRNPGG